MPLKVNEIFYSIQGESLYSGRPCVFVRLTGCNLRCRYCDTTYAYEQGQMLDIDAIVKRVTGFECSLVELTGGEPLLQEDTPALTRCLLELGCEIIMETNGSLDINRVDPRCVRIMDLKCPSSGEQESNDLENLRRLTPHDQVKFVIGDRIDFEFAANIIKQQELTLPGGNILLSPAAGWLAPEHLAAWILESRLNVRFQLQLHKIIWPDKDRGV